MKDLLKLLILIIMITGRHGDSQSVPDTIVLADLSDVEEQHDEAIEEKTQEEANSIVTTNLPYLYPYNGNEVCTYINVDPSKSVLFVGDSRTVGFHISTKYDEFAYLAKGSMGYNWLVNGTDLYNPTNLIVDYINANPSGTVVFNLGVNDAGNKVKYAEWITQFATTHPEANLVYLSVNPVLYNQGLDSMVDEFNSYVRANIPSSVKWLDSNSYLKQIGFSAGDGVHYVPSTYYDLLNFMLTNL